ncbi:hypothetical protein [Lacibacter sp. H407]|uniref:hypothetical protein n=1 Tax=Lacibacter sp. H407 TaxID=3133423 RepID=UPI0030BC6DFC
MLALKTIYLANILVAGWISIVSLFFPLHAQKTIFSNSVAYSEVIRLTGALWGAIFILSVLGLWFPQKMQLVLLFQLLYKTTWILFVALPAILSNLPYPKGMALFFIVWMIVLPGIIDWNYLFTL